MVGWFVLVGGSGGRAFLTDKLFKEQQQQQQQLHRQKNRIRMSQLSISVDSPLLCEHSASDYNKCLCQAISSDASDSLVAWFWWRSFWKEKHSQYQFVIIAVFFTDGKF